jgi:hypothetical protein
MKIGLVGYQRSGKSLLFEWLTGVAADLALAHAGQSAMATVADERIEPLRAIYRPKKVTPAALELVDIPGLSRTHEGNAARLSLIREAGCLVLVVAAYQRQQDPVADLTSLQEDFLLADLEIVTSRAERLRESLRKPRPNRDELEAELAVIEPIAAHLESGRALSELPLKDPQLKAVRSFALLTQKPRLALFNIADDADPSEWASVVSGCAVVAVPLSLEVELARMAPDEAAAFRQEMRLASCDRHALIRQIMAVAGQHLFFTVGPKELRAWMTPQGTTAWEAAGQIHSDMARGFIRAETMASADLIRLGSQREVKAQGLMRAEPKDYVIQDGDVLLIRFSA